MKWFMKVLRHYADFSGRARRKEYWMFVLFNVIFMFAWMLLVALFANLGSSGQSQSELPLIMNLTWMAMLTLPGLAVGVRRLHDEGKSGWMLLVGLIPVVGGIWLLILMASDGQPENNGYGPNPKRSTETFTDRAKLTSVGIALAVAASVSLIVSILPGGESMLYRVINLIVNGLMLTAGIMLFNSGERKNTRPALMALMIAVLIVMLRGLLNLTNFAMIVSYAGWITGFSICMYPLFYLCVALFCAALLFSTNPKLIRNAGLLVVVFAGMDLLWCVYMLAGMGTLGSPTQVLNVFTLMVPVVFILLAWTFLSKQEQPAVEASPEAGTRYEADEQVVYQPSSSAMPAGSAPKSSSGKSLGWKIFGLFVSIGLIIGGLSGEMVLRGTESSGALVAFGILFLILDIISLFTHNKSGKRKKEYEQQLEEGAISSVELTVPATIRVVRDSSVIGAIISYKVYLNHEFIGKIGNGKSLDILTSVSHNIITVFDQNDNPFKGDFTTDLEAGGYAEVHVKAGRFVKK